MKFHVEDTGIDQYFTGKIVNYDGCTGKYGVYFPSDGEVVYIYPDDEDVVFLTWLANTLLLGSEYLEVFVYVAIYHINLYPWVTISTIYYYSHELWSYHHVCA